MGKIAPMMDQEFALADTAAAHTRMESSQHIGKIVLKVSKTCADTCSLMGQQGNAGLSGLFKKVGTKPSFDKIRLWGCSIFQYF